MALARARQPSSPSSLCLPPRPDQATFAHEILRRDHERSLACPADAALVFFDRSPLEAIAMIHEATPMPEAQLRDRVRAYRFHGTVSSCRPGRPFTEPTQRVNMRLHIRSEFTVSCCTDISAAAMGGAASGRGGAGRVCAASPC